MIGHIEIRVKTEKLASMSTSSRRSNSSTGSINSSMSQNNLPSSSSSGALIDGIRGSGRRSASFGGKSGSSGFAFNDNVLKEEAKIRRTKTQMSSPTKQSSS